MHEAGLTGTNLTASTNTTYLDGDSDGDSDNQAKYKHEIGHLPTTRDSSSFLSLPPPHLTSKWSDVT